MLPMFCQKFQTPDTEIDKRIFKCLITKTVFITLWSQEFYTSKITLYTQQLRHTYIIQFRDNRIFTINDKHQNLWVRVMVCNATFNNISVILWRPAFLVEETGVHSENHWPSASHWQTWSHNVSSTPRLSGIQNLWYNNT